jgi:hypothetical protein
MTIDPNQHVIDPTTGFAVDKDTGHFVGLTPKPHLPVTDETEWPKWVVAHESHIHRHKVKDAPEHVSAPEFEHVFVNRATGEVTVLVYSEEDAAKATSAKSDAPVEHHDDEHDPKLEPVVIESDED